MYVLGRREGWFLRHKGEPTQPCFSDLVSAPKLKLEWPAHQGLLTSSHVFLPPEVAMAGSFLGLDLLCPVW